MDVTVFRTRRLVSIVNSSNEFVPESLSRSLGGDGVRREEGEEETGTGEPRVAVCARGSINHDRETTFFVIWERTVRRVRRGVQNTSSSGGGVFCFEKN